jgi:sugar lactone lactonase YvrE
MGAAEGAFNSTVSLTAGTLIVSDTNADAIFAVDPANGKRMLVSKFNVRGSGPEIALPRGIILDSSNNIYVVNTSPVVAIIKIDPVTGNRTTVSSSTAGVGTGPNFLTPSGIAIRSDGKLIVSDTGGTNGNAGSDAIFVVDPATGNRTILSDDVTPNTTNALTSASALLIHSTLGILVSDNALTDAITKIDGTTGEKTVFSSNTVPNGTNPISTPAGLAEDADQSILLVEQGNRQLLRLNTSTGARTVVASFPSTDTFEGVAVGTSGIFVTKTSPNPDQIFKVNPSTGALTLAAGNSFGDGVFFGSPSATTGVITIGFNLGIAVVKAATVMQRRIYYNNSTSSIFGNGSGNPINAIDPTKTALLPGETVTTNANYTNYSRGLNGIIVDTVGSPNLAGISPASFQFATWSTFPDSTPNFLTINPTVTVSTFAGGGLNGSDRVKIEFPNNAIQNAWLRVTMLADANTGLAANDVFYFGNARFDVTPVPTFPTQVTVNAFDVNVLRSRQGQNPGVISNIHDVDRSGVVNAFDTNFVRAGLGIASLRAFTAPSSLQMSFGTLTLDSALIDMSWQDEFRFGNNKHRQQKRG